MEIEQRYTKHVLTEEEKKSIAQEMAQAVSDKHTAEEELKAVKADFKSKIDAADATINGFARKLQTGYDMRMVDCEVEKNYDLKVFIFRSLETGKEVDRRMMRPEDLQQQVI